jgi:AcrR family transcriptional regulator
MAYRATAKTEAHRLKTRERIMEAAQMRVLAGGFANVSMTAVAADADVATGTLYRYFQGKTELCTELFRGASQREVDEIARIARGPGSAVQRLADATRNFASRAIRGRHLAYALIAEPLDPALERERLEFRQAYAEVFQVLLEDGMAAGEFTAMDAQIAATALVGVLSESLVGPLAPASQKLNASQQQHLTHEICRFCLRAVGGRR